MALTVKRVELGRPKLNILVFGPPGVGKTVLAASAAGHPDLGPALIANFEGGLLSVASMPNLDSVEIHSMAQMDELFWELRNGSNGFDKYKTVIIDSGSEMQTLALEEATRLELKRDREKGKVNDRTIDELEIQTYGKAGAQLSRIMRWYRDLPMHTIVTALPRFTFAQGVDQRIAIPIEVEPLFTKKVGVQIMGYMDCVWYYGNKNGQRALITSDMGAYRAKTRGYNFAAALGQVHNDPWLPDIYELLLSSEGTGGAATENVSVLQNLTAVEFEVPQIEKTEIEPVLEEVAV